MAALIIRKYSNSSASSCELDDEVYQTIKIHFEAIGLTKIEYLKATDGSMGLFWRLTTSGKKEMFNLKVTKSSSAE